MDSAIKIHEDNKNICPLCNRKLDGDIEEHHLVPKMHKGKVKVKLHRICHSKIHHTFTEKELQKKYNTIESIQNHEDMIFFIKWVQSIPSDKFFRNKDTNNRRKRRKR